MEHGSTEREILNVEEAAAFLGVSVKTFNKVLHTENIPARKIGREWKFSRTALIQWVGSGHSNEFYRETSSTNGRSKAKRGGGRQGPGGWSLELD